MGFSPLETYLLLRFVSLRQTGAVFAVRMRALARTSTREQPGSLCTSLGNQMVCNSALLLSTLCAQTRGRGNVSLAIPQSDSRRNMKDGLGRTISLQAKHSRMFFWCAPPVSW